VGIAGTVLEDAALTLDIEYYRAMDTDCRPGPIEIADELDLEIGNTD
jgi:hypothetical protein